MQPHSQADVSEGGTRFLDCPEYLDTAGAARCGLPAEVEARYLMRSTDGPLECARIRCPCGHFFNGPIESLAIPEQLPAGVVSVGPLAPPYPYK